MILLIIYKKIKQTDREKRTIWKRKSKDLIKGGRDTMAV
jgi:hypothetical protein